MLKCDESFIIKVVLRGEVKGISAVRFDIRADGISQIKTPEYRVKEVMFPVVVGFAIAIIPFMFLMPTSEMFVGIMPMKLFLLVCMAFVILIIWIMTLLKRIKWLKEQ